MKKVLAVVAFLIVAAVAANVLMKGGLPFLQSMSEEEKAIAELRSELRDAQQQYRQAGRAAALSGMATPAEAEGALRTVERIEKELRALKGDLKTETAKTAARNLEEEIQDFKQELR
jgi:hypothetical protein